MIFFKYRVVAGVKSCERKNSKTPMSSAYCAAGYTERRCISASGTNLLSSKRCFNCHHLKAWLSY